MHPTRKSTLVLLVAAVVLFVLSASGQPGTYWAGGPELIGTIGRVHIESSSTNSLFGTLAGAPAMEAI